jgi:acyl-CoA synthetase (NDP forming)
LVAIANPLDYNTFIWNNEPAMIAAFSALASGGYDLNLLVLDFPRTDRCSDADWMATVNAFEAALKANGARGAIVASMGENLPEHHAADMMARGIVPLLGIPEAMDAAEAAAFVGEAWAGALRSPLRGGSDGDAGRGGGGAESSAALTTPTPPAGHPPRKGEEILTEPAAKALLAAHGLPVPRGIEAASSDEAVAAAHELGFPVAFKATGVAHKSEAGAVVLNLRDEAAVREAAHRLVGIGTGLFVERMVQGGVAELIVGVTRDPLFGPVMTVGSGGVLVELLKDSATLLLPASRADIEASLRGLKLFPLLDGFRGRPKADVPAAVDAIEGIARFVLAQSDSIEELDINPLIVCEQGAWIADALLVGRESNQ